MPGVNPAKWVSIWRERRPEPLELVPLNVLDNGVRLRAGEVDAALVRLPVDRTGLDVIPLYEEVRVVLLPAEHLLTVLDEVTSEDLAEEIVLSPLDDLAAGEVMFGLPAGQRPASTEAAVALVGAGIGLLVTPMSLARLHNRKDLTYRPLADGAASGIGLAWMRERTTEEVEEFIGIVRGRTANSSRGRAAAAADAGEEKEAVQKTRPSGPAPRTGGSRDRKRTPARGAAARRASSRGPKPGTGKGKR